MSLGHQLWLMRRCSDQSVVFGRGRELRRRMRQRYLDYGPRGRGGKAWKRLDRLQRSEYWQTVTVGDLVCPADLLDDR